MTKILHFHSEAQGPGTITMNDSTGVMLYCEGCAKITPHTLGMFERGSTHYPVYVCECTNHWVDKELADILLSRKQVSHGPQSPHH